MVRKVETEDETGRPGKIEAIVEAYAREHRLGNAKAMLTAWLTEPPKGEGLDTYDVADKIGCSHQGVSYLAKKYGIVLVGNRSVVKMEAKAKELGFTDLSDYFDKTTGQKTTKAQADELGVSEMTVRRHRKSLRNRSNQNGASGAGSSKRW